MNNINFFSVLISNFKCAFCSNKFCEVRYFPQRKNSYFYNEKNILSNVKKMLINITIKCLNYNFITKKVAQPFT